MHSTRAESGAQAACECEKRRAKAPFCYCARLARVPSAVLGTFYNDAHRPPPPQQNYRFLPSALAASHPKDITDQPAHHTSPLSLSNVQKRITHTHTLSTLITCRAARRASAPPTRRTRSTWRRPSHPPLLPLPSSPQRPSLLSSRCRRRGSYPHRSRRQT